MQHGAAEPRRLEWVVPALGDQRTADKGDPGKAVEQPELAHRVREIDLRAASDRIAASAPGDAQPLLRQHCPDGAASRRVAGNDDRQQTGIVRGEVAMYLRGNLLVARLSASGGPQRTRTGRVARARRFGAVERQCGSGSFESADGGYLARAQRAESFGLRFAL